MTIDPQLPGAELVTKGLADLETQSLTIEALLVVIAAPALQLAGLTLPPRPSLTDDAEILLYLKLQETEGDSAHTRYNSLIQRIVSFEQCFSRAKSLSS